MSKISIEVTGISIEDMLSVMVTGLNDADQVAWESYLRAEHGAFSKELTGTGGVRVSGKADKGRVAIKGGQAKAKNIRLNRALYALHLATAVLEVAKSTGFECMTVDVSPLCAAWKAKRDGKSKDTEPEYADAEMAVE